MAGIGFELRRMLDKRAGFLAKVRAYACAGLISSGPWLMTILTLTLLSLMGPLLAGEKEDYSLFRACVTYCFAFSLILQGGFQMAVTRWTADLLYSRQNHRVLPAFTATLALVGLLHFAVGTIFFKLAGFPHAFSFVGTMLFVILGMTWIALTWLSVARSYDEVLRGYVYGTVISVVGMVLLGTLQGNLGLLTAYTVGQAFTLIVLIRVILRGMASGGGRELGVLTAPFRFPRLLMVGLFYNVAIWADKFVFWFLDGTGEHPWVQFHPLYDTCSFLAYFTVVPALAVNLIRLETSFYEFYRAYYSSILGGFSLARIEDARKAMFENLREGTIRLVRVQGAISIAVIIFAPFIIRSLELPPVAIRVFRLAAIGAFFHVLLLLTILMQLYFELRLQAVATSAVFLVLNAVLAWWSVETGVATYGVGYAIASFLSLLLGFLLLHQNLEHLDYMTFTNQKIEDDVPPETREAAATKTQPDDAEEADLQETDSEETELEDTDEEELPVEDDDLAVPQGSAAPAILVPQHEDPERRAGAGASDSSDSEELDDPAVVNEPATDSTSAAERKNEADAPLPDPHEPTLTATATETPPIDS